MRFPTSYGMNSKVVITNPNGTTWEFEARNWHYDGSGNWTISSYGPTPSKEFSVVHSISEQYEEYAKAFGILELLKRADSSSDKIQEANRKVEDIREQIKKSCDERLASSTCTNKDALAILDILKLVCPDHTPPTFDTMKECRLTRDGLDGICVLVNRDANCGTHIVFNHQNETVCSAELVKGDSAIQIASFYSKDYTRVPDCVWKILDAFPIAGWKPFQAPVRTAEGPKKTVLRSLIDAGATKVRRKRWDRNSHVAIEEVGGLIIAKGVISDGTSTYSSKLKKTESGMSASPNTPSSWFGNLDADDWEAL